MVIPSSTVGLQQLNVGFNPSTFESLTAQINRLSRHKNTDSLQDCQLKISIFLGVLRPAWPIDP